ncbi:hypothetical protein E2C01_045134 [Portunus trituberculatus]|uniref:Uncharacterized protein n=1 Tax=Portunus trituberculatus TaxID=210409 RepID=A0A5B7G2B9_PORTR|nr:hypothetical protein [Portunus trituberculatus]
MCPAEQLLPRAHSLLCALRLLLAVLCQLLPASEARKEPLRKPACWRGEPLTLESAGEMLSECRVPEACRREGHGATRPSHALHYSSLHVHIQPRPAWAWASSRPPSASRPRGA